MILRIVNFTLDGIDDEQYRRHAATVADGFNEWTGLTAKLWLHNPDTGTYGGAYLFTDQAAADASRATDLFRDMERNPAFADLSVREFGVIDDLTAITGGVPDGARPVGAGRDREARSPEHAA
jgi:hypothetical protein